MSPGYEDSRVVRPAGRLSPWRRIVAGVLACVLLAGCASTTMMSSVAPSDLTELVSPGDKVRCTLRDNTVVEFKVKKVHPGVLIGETQRVEVKDISRLDVNRLTRGRTAGLVVLVVLAGAVSYGLSNMAFFPPVP